MLRLASDADVHGEIIRGPISHLLRDLREFQVMQMPIQRIAREQFAVDADGFDAAFVQEQHLVAGADRRNAMRKEEDRAARQNAEHGVIELRLRVLVERLLRLLNDEQGGIAQDGAGQGDSELLADIERMA